MSNEKIINVLYKNNGQISSIPLDEMTKEFYQINKEFLFCPNHYCGANIEYCEGNKLVYYRTAKAEVDEDTIIEQHIEGCKYGLEHSTVSTPKKLFDPTVGYLVSDDHVQDALKRAHNQHLDPEYGKPKSSTTKKKKGTTSINTKGTDVDIRGRATIGKSDGDSIKTPNEPALYQRFIDQITEKDFDTSKLVKGTMTDIIFNKNYITIQLSTSNGIPGRMYFSEGFKVDNAQQFDQMNYYKQYLVNQNRNNKEIFIACAGDVIKDDYGVSIYVKSHKHISIDGLTHYALLKSINVY